ncbi:plasmid pRiA4b ORF-3 family protein [Altericista sp. CCNU0014]|uniref:plasmid pRiA4b ORF-3 family protein n=1 Tax=Altericista sp. CCNU0014 TaxID=3082949 RepID=UPI00384CE348
MARAKKSEDVPKAMQEKFARIVALTDKFAQQHLNAEYAEFIRFATAALCRKRPSPLLSGTEKTWACGITHAIGMVNFLFDASQDPHIRATDLYESFGVSASTGQAKSKLVRDTLKMHQMDPDWCLPSQLDDNPMAWMISVNGYIIDARSAPREFQEIAHAKGLIPYVPGDDRSKTAAPAIATIPKKKAAAPAPTSPKALLVLEAFILDGPITEAFAKKNPTISRTIEIKASNTLEDLHKILFKAFGREEEHLYEFQVGGRGPHDSNARRYGLKQAFSDPDDELAGDVSTTTLGELGLTEDESFGYWFDFGDDWWHQIDVLSITEDAPSGKYPKIAKRVGANPPQYADFD